MSNNIDVIRGTASQVRLNSRSWSEGTYYDRHLVTEYICLMRVSGKSVELRLKQPIHIEKGDQVTIVGFYDSTGVFNGSGYRNITTGVTVAETPSDGLAWLSLIGGAVVSGFYVFLLIRVSPIPACNIFGIIALITVFYSLIKIRNVKRQCQNIYSELNSHDGYQ